MAGQYQDDDTRYLLINLQGTTAKSGRLVSDDDSCRGWFTYAVEVTIKLLDPTNFQPLAGYLRTADFPPEAADYGSVSNSVSQNLGAMGPYVSANWTNTKTTGVTEEDFRTQNLSDEHTVHHIYQLSMAKDGTAIEKPEDLCYLASPLDYDGGIRQLPGRATDSLPIVSWGQWYIDGSAWDALSSKTVAVQINLTHTLYKVAQSVTTVAKSESTGAKVKAVFGAVFGGAKGAVDASTKVSPIQVPVATPSPQSAMAYGPSVDMDALCKKMTGYEQSEYPADDA